jgi:long-chain acyl-CoA synthetase
MSTQRQLKMINKLETCRVSAGRNYPSMFVSIRSNSLAMTPYRCISSSAARSSISNDYVVEVAPGIPNVQSPVYRSKNAADKLVETTADNVRTLYENFRHGQESVKKSKNGGRCFGDRNILTGEFEWMSYDQVAEKCEQFGSGLMHFGIKPGDKLGIYSKNSINWGISEMTCNFFSLTSVPLYDTLGSDAVEYIIRFTEMPALVCTSDKTANVLGKTKGGPGEKLKLIVELDGTVPIRKVGEIVVMSLSHMLELGKKNPHPVVPPKPSDIATISFTSGTTGMPKGAVLTHANFCAGAAGAASSGILLTPTDVHLSYLPLAHAFERIVSICVVHCGAAIGFYSGDTAKILDDAHKLSPTIFPSVPRLFNRIYERVNNGVHHASFLKKTIFKFAYNQKVIHLKKSGAVTHWLWDPLVFHQFRKLLGNRVHLMISGSAPISEQVKTFMQVVFSSVLLEGYGLTETCATGTLEPASCRGFGIGIPKTCTEIKLQDIPEMNFSSSDVPNPRGELCLRGPNVFSGYYKDPVKTAESFDKDGFFHTGDVVEILPNGCLHIVDRVKNLLKLSQGEYVPIEKVEAIICGNAGPLVSQVFAYGDSERDMLVGIIVPEQEQALKWAVDHGFAPDLVSLCKNETFIQEVQASIDVVAKEKLRGFEKLGEIYLEPNPFTVENGALTPTFKLKRHELKKKYGTIIEEMYKRIAIRQSANPEPKQK